MQPPEAPSSVRTATTLVLPGLPASPARAPAPDNQALDELGGAPSLSAVTSTLRRARLGSATLALITAISVGMLWGVAHHPYAVLWPLDLTVIIALGAAYALLAGSRPLSSLWLWRLEMAIFGGTAALLAIDLVYAGSVWGTRGVPGGLAAAVKNSMIATIMLIFAYAMLIPNTSRAAARLIAVMAVLPFVTQGLLYLLNAQVARTARLAFVALLGPAVENVMLMGMAVALALYGTHVLNVLRREAHEARQLNQYRLVRKLGWGGMGEVYLAEHRFLKRPCAVKLIRSDNAGDPAALARFEREVRSMGKLSHPNIVDIYDYGHTEDGTFYYVMEYLSGFSLEGLVERNGPLPPGRVVFLLRQACKALGEAHGAGLIHRDLKPSNIFVTRRGARADWVKLIDFGLVKTLEPEEDNDLAISREGHVRGTPQWMAPEQAVGSGVLDARCDLYALGGIGYFLLTGGPPFGGDSSMAVIVAQVRDPVEPPSKRRAGVPADLEAVVLRCLSKKPDDRYPDAAALGRALAACACAKDWDARRAAEWWAGHIETDPAAASWPRS